MGASAPLPVFWDFLLSPLSYIDYSSSPVIQKSIPGSSLPHCILPVLMTTPIPDSPPTTESSTFRTTSMINELAREIHENSKAHGFWDECIVIGDPAGRVHPLYVIPTIPLKLALIHSEISEALEEYRKPGFGSFDTHFTSPEYRPNSDHPDKPEGFAVELADAVIRCFDLMHALGVDIESVIKAKMVYNASRPYKHGKTC